MAKGDTGELLLAKANAYVDTFVRRAVEMIWGCPKDIIQIQMPWVERIDQVSGTRYRDYNGTVHVDHDGVQVIVEFYIKLHPQDGGLPTNVYGWSPREHFACSIRSIPSLKGVVVNFDHCNAEGTMGWNGESKSPITAKPKMRSFNAVLKIREELGIESRREPT